MKSAGLDHVRWLENRFQIRAKGSSLRQESLAGLTTFAAMAYILAVHPSMLTQTGMDLGALITVTAVASAFGSFLMAVLTNYPIALAPGMGINAFFTFSVCLGQGVPWQAALSCVFWNGILFIALTLSGVRRALVAAIPETLKVGTQAGIGLFIAFIGLSKAGIIVDAPTLIALGSLRSAEVLLALGGLMMGTVLLGQRFAPGLLLTIALITALGLWIPASEGNGMITAQPSGWIAWPASPAPIALKVDWWYPFREWPTALPLVLAFLFVDLFDSLGTLVGVSRQANLLDANGDLPKIKGALLADSTATTVGAALGTSTVTSYVESAAGVAAGGKTGLTAIVVAVCFLGALFFHPLIACVPDAATAPALVLVGCLMLQGMRELPWDDTVALVPGLLTIMLIPLAFSITDGIALGFITFCAVMLISGRARQLHWLTCLIALAFALKFLFL